MHTNFLAIVMLVGVVTGCAAQQATIPVASDRRIVGPNDYTVDWDLPETGDYWIPKEEADMINVASEICKAPITVVVFHHVPHPPQFSAASIRFGGDADDVARSCLIGRLKAVPSLTVYPKRYYGQRYRQSG